MNIYDDSQQVERAMSDTSIDVLVYLFDNYLDIDLDFIEQENDLEYELEQAGFTVSEIHKAFDWLGDLAELHMSYENIAYLKNTTIRILTEEEINKLDKDARSFFIGLEQLGLLDAPSREMILDRMMAIETDTLTLEQFKRIVGLVMINQPGHDAILAWVDALIYDELRDMTIH